MDQGSAALSAVHGNRSELEWLSDAVISMAAAGITYLWLHLRGFRMYATAVVARFETAPGRLDYVNAGHLAGYLLRNATVTAALESGGRPLGLRPEAKYRTADVDWQDDRTVFAFAVEPGV